LVTARDTKISLNACQGNIRGKYNAGNNVNKDRDLRAHIPDLGKRSHDSFTLPGCGYLTCFQSMEENKADITNKLAPHLGRHESAVRPGLKLLQAISEHHF
jgi:hypothetical protein